MNQLKIYIDRLRGGEQLKIEESLPLILLKDEEKELSFKGPIHLKLSAYLAEDHLILHFDAEVIACMPCSICNQIVELPIIIKNHYSTVPLSEMKASVYNCEDEIRDTILLYVPPFTECRPEGCPEREQLKKFISKKEQKTKEPKEHFPFADFL